MRSPTFHPDDEPPVGLRVPLNESNYEGLSDLWTRDTLGNVGGSPTQPKSGSFRTMLTLVCFGILFSDSDLYYSRTDLVAAGSF